MSQAREDVHTVEPGPQPADLEKGIQQKQDALPFNEQTNYLPPRKIVTVCFASDQRGENMRLPLQLMKSELTEGSPDLSRLCGRRSCRPHGPGSFPASQKGKESSPLLTLEDNPSRQFNNNRLSPSRGPTDILDR
jgi:hypothetical protein